MKWFKWFKRFKDSQEEEKKWQFYVVDIGHKGYRINTQCMPLWETPEGVEQYFLGTRAQADEKRQELLENWLATHGSPAREIRVEDYVEIPQYKSRF